MNWWTIAIYGVAGILALQGLFSLMASYRATAVRRIFHEELQRQADQSSAPANDDSVPTSTTKNAA